MKNKINKLNKKIELQTLEKVPDGAGGFNTNWIKVKDIWGNIESINNINTNNYSMLEIKATHLITIRSLNNINKNNRLVYNNVIFTIKYINNLNNNFTDIICECSM